MSVLQVKENHSGSTTSPLPVDTWSAGDPDRRSETPEAKTLREAIAAVDRHIAACTGFVRSATATNARELLIRGLAEVDFVTIEDLAATEIEP